MFDPVQVYRGADNQFEGMSEGDKAYLAQYMEAEFADRLGKRFKRADAPGRDALRRGRRLLAALRGGRFIGRSHSG